MHIFRLSTLTVSRIRIIKHTMYDTLRKLALGSLTLFKCYIRLIDIDSELFDTIDASTV